MIELILPSAVRHAEAYDDIGEDELFLVERAVVANAVSARQREFATVRRCARQALAYLGIERMPLLPGDGGIPGWPEGVVGSMTHCVGYRAAAVAHDSDVGVIGIDAEPNKPLPEGVLGLIALPEDCEGLARLPRGEVAWDRVLFSAKEAVYKSWFPLTHRFLQFEEAAVMIDPDGTFEARLLVPGPTLDGQTLDGFSGRWVAANGLVMTGVSVPRRSKMGDDQALERRCTCNHAAATMLGQP